MDLTKSPGSSKNLEKAFVTAWIFGLIFYFLEYVIRSSPAVMITELSGAFKVTPLGLSSILGAYYYTYSTTSLIAGMALDRVGAKISISVGVGILCLGCLLFALPDAVAGEAGRLLQGAGSAFAFTGCVYLASHGFSARYLATAIGVTQCLGMLGGSAGQFMVGPMIQNGLSVHVFWIGIGIACGAICLLLYTTTPPESKAADHPSKIICLLLPYKTVFTNLQSYLSGLLSGLLFAPTTIFTMTWGVAFFQQDRQMDYHSAVVTCSMTPLGWVIGCPLLGWISDRMGHRKPVLSGGIILMLLSFAQLVFLPSLFPAALSMLVFGIASGAAMIPYTIIKEANPDKVKGSAIGAINFLTFSMTAILGPVFSSHYGKTLMSTTDHPGHFRAAGGFLCSSTFIALIVSFIIKETGHGAHKR